MTDWTEQDIRTQLERIVTSHDFADSPKLVGFLTYVVNRALEGRVDRIKQYEIAVEGLDYRRDFDPGSNPSVRIMARRLRRALKRYYANSGASDPIRIQIPKGRYAPRFSGNAEESQVVSTHFSDASARFGGELLGPTIAVIGIECLNNPEKCAHIAVGLTEEIIIALTGFSKFQVKGPLKRKVIEKEGMDLPELGRRYGVRFVLDGTIRSISTSFRLSVRLVDTASGHQLWGEVLDSGLDSENYLDFENHVVSRVAATVGEGHGVIPTFLLNEAQKRGNRDLSAYEAILHYYNYNRYLDENSYVRAVGGLEQVANDPAATPDATVYGSLADLVAESWLFGMTDDESVLQRADRLARKALSIDPSNQAARFSVALVHALRYERDAFLEEADHTLQANPHNAVFLAATALHLTMAGKQEEGMRLIRKAMLLNPHYPSWYHIVPYMVAYREEDYDRAWSYARKFSMESFYWDPLIRAAVLGRLDRLPEAARAVDELIGLVPDFRQRGRSLIRRLVFQEESVEALAAGLRKAGLELELPTDQVIS